MSHKPNVMHFSEVEKLPFITVLRLTDFISFFCLVVWIGIKPEKLKKDARVLLQK